jgi:hypothetical protein
MRLLVFLVLAAALTAYSFWVYLRVELRVPAARGLALLRAAAMVLLLLLLFDPRVPIPGAGAAPARWALLDASTSMAATGADGGTVWSEALARAEALEADGWTVVRFGGERLDADPEVSTPDGGPSVAQSRLLPALQAAAEAGAREVRVLSDMRFEDAVAVRGAAEALPLSVTLEAFGAGVVNRGVARLNVPDVPRPDVGPVAEVEVHGGTPGDSIQVAVLEEGREVARVQVGSPSPGLRAMASVELPAPEGRGRVRYEARVVAPRGDDFSDDDGVVAYATVGFEEGGLTLVSLRPDWEPRHLLPVLEEVTGLSAQSYLRAGADRYVRSGRADDRGPPVDSTTVRQAASASALLVLHGLGGDAEPWIRGLAARSVRRLVFPADPSGARLVGIEAASTQGGEWYASPDVPTSPVAGALAGVELQGLPPLTDVMVAERPDPQPVLQLQLRGAGAPQAAFHLVDDPEGRLAVALAADWWRWSARDEGLDAYRRLWSGLAGWLLAGERAAVAEPRPAAWVLPVGSPVPWVFPALDSSDVRTVVANGEVTVVDTVLGRDGASTRPLEAGTYQYRLLDPAGDTLGSGRFDVVRSTVDMVPAPVADDFAALAGAAAVSVEAGGRPLRTSPLPYLLLITLLCAEWIVRRRTGLR